MKTFEQFISITEGISERINKMSDSEFDNFMKGRHPAEAETFRRNRISTNPASRTSTPPPHSGANASASSTGTASGTRPPRPYRGVPESPSSRFQTAQPPAASSRPPGASGSVGTPPPPPGASRTSPPPSGAVSPNRGIRGRFGQGIRIASGLGGAAGAINAASRGDYDQAAQNALLAAGSSNRINRAVTAGGQRALQATGRRLGIKALANVGSRFVPGLNTAYGLYRGTSALAKGDYVGAGLGYASAIPVVGGAFALADIARETDLVPGFKSFDAKGASATNTRSARQVAASSNAYGSRQGSAVSGLGGPMGVDYKNNAILTKGRVAKLAPTQLVRDPKTGKQVVGDLAYRGGAPVYMARPSIASRDTNVFSRFSRWSGIGGQREADAQAARGEYRTALRNTQQYTRQLGISPQAATNQKLPGYGVGPKKVGAKKVGPKIVGPKKVGPKPVQGPASSLVRPA